MLNSIYHLSRILYPEWNNPVFRLLKSEEEFLEIILQRDNPWGLQEQTKKPEQREEKEFTQLPGLVWTYTTFTQM